MCVRVFPFSFTKPGIFKTYFLVSIPFVPIVSVSSFSPIKSNDSQLFKQTDGGQLKWPPWVVCCAVKQLLLKFNIYATLAVAVLNSVF